MPLTRRKTRYRVAEYSDLRNGRDKSVLGAGKELRVVRVKSLTRRRYKFRRAAENFYSAAARIWGTGISIEGSILIGLLKAYLCVGTVAWPEDRIEVRRRDELKISRGPDAAFAASPPTKMDTCYPTFYNVPSLRSTSCTMHKNNRQLNFIKIFKEKDRCKWTFTHTMYHSIDFTYVNMTLYVFLIGKIKMYVIENYIYCVRICVEFW